MLLIMAKVFKVTNISKKWLLRQTILGRKKINYNFVSRIKYYPATWGYNRKKIGDFFYKLHYYACHSPTIIQKHYKNAYINFDNKHFASKGNASVRYLNKYTCHKWV